MNKINQLFEDLISDFSLDLQDREYVYQLQADIVKLLTPKLQWKSEEITNDGGDNLLATKYVLQNVDVMVSIIDHTEVDECTVRWNHESLFTGTLEECKQFCSDKILEDFLKLCE